jgi:thiol-disulfide isomerase/thioredoxin
MKNCIIRCMIVMSLAACKKEGKQDGFILNGTAKNVEDNSIIFLQIDNKIVDSTAVKSEKFQFKGAVNHPTSCIITLKNSNDYKFLWLENETITFSGEKNNFQNATISGSLVQKDSDELSERLSQVEKVRDSLNALLMTLDGDGDGDALFQEFNKTIAQTVTINQDFVREKPNSPVSLHILNIYKTTWGKEVTQELFNLTSKENQNSKKGNFISQYLELYGNPQIGEKYIDFGQNDSNDNYLKISDKLGKYTLIEFWSSWCGPCRQSNPSLVRLYDDYNEKGFEIIGVSLDEDKTAWVKAIEKDQLSWTNISDLKGSNNEGALRYGVTGIPDNILIDEQGTIIARRVTPQILRKSFEAAFSKI